MAWGVKHGAWSFELGAWGMERGAWGVGIKHDISLRLQHSELSKLLLLQLILLVKLWHKNLQYQKEQETSHRSR